MLSSAKQKREMTKVLRRVRNRDDDANFSYFHLRLTAVIAYLA